MNWLEEKYTLLLSNQVRNFKKRGNKYNFSCPICNDSTRNKFKARGYVLPGKTHARYFCHKCQANMSFATFLKQINHSLYNQYMVELLGQNKNKDPLLEFTAKMRKPKFMTEGILKDLQKVSQLSPNDPVKQFVVNRKIPTTEHHKLFKADKFMAFSNKWVPGKFSEKALKYDGPRLLIPFFDKDNICFGYQGRAVDDDEIRYITIVVDEEKPKFWGLERIDYDSDVFVFEGPIDAMFIDNAIASAGTDMVSTLASLAVPKEKFILAYDNEPHKKETIAKINKAISHNYKVLIYPDSFEYKDVNEAILGGMSATEVMFIVLRNVYSGLSARARLAVYNRS